MFLWLEGLLLVLVLCALINLGMSNEIEAIEKAIIWPQYVKGEVIPLYVLTLSRKYWLNSFICFGSEEKSFSQRLYDDSSSVDWCNFCNHNWSWRY